AAEIARFSAGEVGWFAFFTLVSVGLVLLISRGVFAGARSRAVWAAAALGLVIVVDLGRADTPWIKYYDYKSKYASNGVLALLANKPYEHRITLPPLNWDRNYGVFQQVYNIEWLQNQFPYYNIQSLDFPQDPRPPADKVAYRGAFSNDIVRLWELTNTRFIGGVAANFVEALNQQFDPAKRRFRVHTRFVFSHDDAGNIGARIDENGPWALLEFTGALARAALFTQWEVNTNQEATLARLANPAFDPHQSVIVADPIAPSVPAGAATNNAGAGTVEF